MDPAWLLRRARSSAQLSKVELARKSGTSTAALRAYETGRRSPTVATLNRLLAACGLQLRGDLEPLHADVDALVDAALAGGSAGADYNTASVVRGFGASAVGWALDGCAALLAHGLAVEAPFGTELAVLDSPQLRDLLRELWARPRDHDGFPIPRDWAEVDLAQLGPQPMWTRSGFVLLRVVPELTPVLIDLPVADQEPIHGCPVLSLLDVELAHPSLAQLLGRLRDRRTVCS